MLRYQFINQPSQTSPAAFLAAISLVVAAVGCQGGCLLDDRGRYLIRLDQNLSYSNFEVNSNEHDNRFLDALSQKKYLVVDGATGTNLIQRGLPHGTSAEDWVLNNPDAISRLHKDFLEVWIGYYPDLHIRRFTAAPGSIRVGGSI